MHHNNITQTIKARREALHITQEVLSEISGVGLRTIKQIEAGRGNPTLETIEKITDVLGMELCLQVKQTNS